ncbi:AAA family ATPase [Achromobacter sp. Root170]|uniref:AAA family ATPase n=1 Tax=Achromobacter sp. Root170 TaxID=1736480 RepID=UPI00138F760A|nr:AAA family ATPase [Achromobacter sp. Root170]
MQEAEFKAWLEAQKYNDATVAMQVNRARRISQSYGDLDELFKSGGLERLQQELAYSKEDERSQKPNPAKFSIDGNIYNNMATYRKTIDYYRQFSMNGTKKQIKNRDATKESIEAAMDEFDEIGLNGFKEKYGFGSPQKYWVLRPTNGKRYPAKAIVGVSYGHFEDGFPLKVADFSGGQGEQAANGILRKLGYEIVTSGSEEPESPETQVLSEMLMPGPTNLILYGPPGTGKTYHTVREAVALCDGIADYPASKEGRAALMARYNELVAKNRIGFVTFHQNYGYEDFVEGLRPVPITNGNGESVGFHLQPEPGIFRQIAERAATERLVAGSEAFNLTDRAIYKMSLGDVADSASDFVFTESINGGYALLGFSDTDWSDPRFEDRDEIFSAIKERFPDEGITANKGLVQSPDVFRNQLEIGDVLIVAKGNHRFRAIGIVDGGYEYAPRPNGRYCHRRKVNWLWHNREGLEVGELYPPKFIQKTIYRLKDSELNRPLIAQLISDSGDAGEMTEPLSHVLVIDEINRANVSKVFGELITLLEADKRAGMGNALSVTLPYSKRSFSVPANLHIVATMNSADRSIALLDTALRRRFSFREMAPDPTLLGMVEGIDLNVVLATLNRRIEYLIDREHRIGHAFFINCETKEQVEDAMRDKVIPLLQEYFFEDWSRIAAVLGDGFIREEKIDPPPGIEGDSQSSWSVLLPFKDDAFARLVGKTVAVADSAPLAANESGE